MLEVFFRDQEDEEYGFGRRSITDASSLLELCKNGVIYLPDGREGEYLYKSHWIDIESAVFCIVVAEIESE